MNTFDTIVWGENIPAAFGNGVSLSQGCWPAFTSHNWPSSSLRGLFPRLSPSSEELWCLKVPETSLELLGMSRLYPCIWTHLKKRLNLSSWWDVWQIEKIDWAVTTRSSYLLHATVKYCILLMYKNFQGRYSWCNG